MIIYKCYGAVSSAIYAHFQGKHISQSTLMLTLQNDTKSRLPGSKSATSFSRNIDLSKSKSTNRCVTFFEELRRGIARRHASEQSWLKISQKVPTTLEHQGLRNSRNPKRKNTRWSLSPKKLTFQRVWIVLIIICTSPSVLV